MGRTKDDRIRRDQTVKRMAKIVVLAGVNGAGKSSIGGEFAKFEEGALFNPDTIAARRPRHSGGKDSPALVAQPREPDPPFAAHPSPARVRQFPRGGSGRWRAPASGTVAGNAGRQNHRSGRPVEYTGLGAADPCSRVAYAFEALSARRYCVGAYAGIDATDWCGREGLVGGDADAEKCGGGWDGNGVGGGLSGVGGGVEGVP